MKSSTSALLLLFLQGASTFVPFHQQQARHLKSVLEAKPKVFIDGEAGTTGIQVRDILAKRTDLEIISVPNELRKDEETRKQFINEADAVILCKFEITIVMQNRK